MDVTVNFVWIGQKKLGWLECFIIYTWRMWGCRVNIFTHYPNAGERTHDHESLGLPPNIVEVFDLRAVVAEGEAMPNTRDVLTSWLGAPMPEWGQGGQQLTFNIADLCKSYLAATRKGIVMDLKIGPSPHIKRYVDRRVFHDHFIGCKRAGTIENQLMGSMSDEDERRTAYGTGFETALFKPDVRASDLKAERCREWFPLATAAHNRAMGAGKFSQLGLRGNWIDIGKYGQRRHESELGISAAAFAGIAGEKDYGAVRVFKREDDQTNKSSGVRTTDDDRLEMRRVTIWELADASVGSGPVDVTAEGMPPVADLLTLLSLTEKR